MRQLTEGEEGMLRLMEAASQLELIPPFEWRKAWCFPRTFKSKAAAYAELVDESDEWEMIAGKMAQAIRDDRYENPGGTWPFKQARSYGSDMSMKLLVTLPPEKFNRLFDTAVMTKKEAEAFRQALAPGKVRRLIDVE